MSTKRYKIEYAKSSREDMKRTKKYILNTFKYREYGENFTKIMRQAADSLKVLPTGFDKIGLQYRGYDIYIKPYRTYLLFYIVNSETNTVIMLRVLKDGMDWEHIIRSWLKHEK